MRIETSGSISGIVTALVEVSKGLKTINKNAKARIVSDKGSYEYKYADLPSIQEIIKPELIKNDLIVVQDACRMEEGYLDIRTLLMHTSGEWIATTITMPIVNNNKNKAQATGSIITYGKRYGLAALLNISLDDDDDAGMLDDDKDPDKKRINFDEVKEKLKDMGVDQANVYMKELLPNCVSKNQEKALKGIYDTHIAIVKPVELKK